MVLSEKEIVVLCKHKFDGLRGFFVMDGKVFTFPIMFLTVLGQYFLILISKLAYSFHVM